MNPIPSLRITSAARYTLFNHLQIEFRSTALGAGQKTHDFKTDNPEPAVKFLEGLEADVERLHDLLMQLKAVVDVSQPFTLHPTVNPAPKVEPFRIEVPEPTPTPEKT